MHPLRREPAILLCAVGALAGCQSYEPRPLDLDAHRAQWISRLPSSPGVAEFAQRLAEQNREPAQPFDVSDGLTLREAEAVALFFNPDLRMARLRAGVTAAGAENAGLWEDPTLSVDSVRILESVAEPWKLFASIGVTLPLSGRLEAEKNRAGAEHTAELARVAAQEWTVRVELQNAWAEWSASLAQARATREYLERLEHIVAVVDGLRKAGELSPAQAKPFLVERASRRADLRAMEGRAAEAELSIKSLLGVSPAAPVTLTPAFPVPPLANDAEITDHAPDLAAAAAEYDASERSLALEIRKQYPDLMVAPGYGNEEGSPEALLGLSLPLPILNANRQGIAEARAKRELARGVYETTYERLAGQLAVARSRSATAQAERAQLESELVPLVDSQYEETRRIAEFGEVDTLLLLDSLTRQHEARLRVVAAHLAESVALVRVHQLVGPPSLLDPPDAPPGPAADPRTAP